VAHRMDAPDRDAPDRDAPDRDALGRARERAVADVTGRTRPDVAAVARIRGEHPQGAFFRRPLWLGVLLPDLPLWVHRPDPGNASACESQPKAQVVIGAGEVGFVNAAARRAGLRPGISEAAARAALPQACFLVRALREERRWLLQLATRLYRVTDTLLLRPQGLLLELGGSVRLFDGLAALRQRVYDELDAGLCALGVMSAERGMDHGRRWVWACGSRPAVAWTNAWALSQSGPGAPSPATAAGQGRQPSAACCSHAGNGAGPSPAVPGDEPLRCSCVGILPPRAAAEWDWPCPQSEQVLLDALPVAVLQAGSATAEDRGLGARWLALCAELGLKRLGDLRALPVAGVQQRFGTELVLRLAELYGQRPESIRPLKLRPTRRQVCELPQPLPDVDALLPWLGRSLSAVCTELDRAGQVAGAWRLWLHWAMPPAGEMPTRTAVNLRLARPTRDVQALRGWWRLRLQRLLWLQPVAGFTLEARQVLRWQGETPALLAEQGAAGPLHAPSRGVAGPAWLEDLRQRLGDEAVRQIHARPQHWPALATASRPCLSALPAASVPNKNHLA